jgi:citrate synthase
MADKPSKGLADIIAASAALSDIDGRAGPPSYRGYDIHPYRGYDIHRRAVSAMSGRMERARPDGEHVGERGLTRAPLDRR